MKKEQDSAFPISEEETDRIDAGIKIYSGLSKRLYLAGMAMQGILSNSYWIEQEKAINYEGIVKIACKMADKLLKEEESQ